MANRLKSSLLYLVGILSILVSVTHANLDPSTSNENKADLTLFDPGYTCVAGASSSGKAPSLCDNDADGTVSEDEAQRYKEITMLYYIAHGNISQVEDLVYSGTVNVNCQGVKNPLKIFGIPALDSYLPPVHLAAFRCQSQNHISIAAMLMENGANPDEGSSHRSALSYAWEFYLVGDEYSRNDVNLRRDIINMLYGEGATFPMIPLHFAARLGCVECTKAIAQDGAGAVPKNTNEVFDVNTVNNDNMTALHYAMDVRCEGCVQVLIDAGARVDIPDRHGRNALHHAVYMHSPSMIQMILQGEGVEKARESQDIDGRTPQDLALRWKATPRVLEALGVPKRQWGDATSSRPAQESPLKPDRGQWSWSEQTPLDIDYCDFDVVQAKDLTMERFISDYHSVARPVVIRGLTNEWPAWSRWTREHFHERYGNVSLMTGPIPYANEYGRPTESEVMEVREFIEEMEEGTPDVFDSKLDKTTEPWILFDQGMSTEQPEFLADYRTPSYFRLCGQYTRPQISVGSYGSGAPFHSHVSAWNAVIYGRKRWFVVPPGVAKLRDVETSQQPLSWFQDGNYQQLREAGDVQECVQHAGDVVFVPRLWSHATINLVDTVCVAQEFCTFNPKSDRMSEYLYGTEKARETATQPITRLNTHIRGPIQLIPPHLHDKLESKDVY
eukprot:TRINITY_DN446_c0_g2_i11.p1 TRINITY_DN446_c0_g2~~TRINITY_DN446_c0_g2_i11.p1  ORF type:complete len:670 (+),score=96.30 TRINITY_DN446_c0_g2_i11:180-2189(+)